LLLYCIYRVLYISNLLIEETNLEQAYQKARTADPSYKAAAEFLAIVLTDLGTSLKLAGNTEDGIQKYCEALEVDSHYAVP
jgi:hypothetical protein